MVSRRSFLLLRVANDRVIELSCERLLMKYVDSLIDGSTPALFARLEEELRDVRALRLVDTQWLGRDDFRAELNRVLERSRASIERDAGRESPAEAIDEVRKGGR